MSEPDEELAAAVAAYRAELSAEADLARADLDEIEDHLRALVDELRAAGRGATAIAEARRRLGEPRAVAREHARVRTPFGARPSRAQAWSAAALLTPLTAWQLWLSLHAYGLRSFAGLELILTTIVIGGLWLRQSWARAIVLGNAVASLAPCLLALAITPDTRMTLLALATNAGTVAFLWPRRRGELSPTGVALALLAPAYVGAMITLLFQQTGPRGDLLAHTWALLAVGGALATGAGLMMRARWGCVAALATAAAILRSGYDLIGLTWRFEHPIAQRVLIFGWIVGGACAAAGAAVIAWRHARPGVGTLRDVISLR